MVQRVRLHLAVSTRDTGSSLVGEDSACSAAAKPAATLLSSRPNACKSQPLSLCAATAEAMRPELALHGKSSQQ